MANVTEDGLERLLCDISHENHQMAVRQFLAEKRANGATLGTLYAQGQHMRAWARHLDTKPFLDATKPDVVAFINTRTSTREYRPNGRVARRKRITLSEATINQRKIVVKMFQRWIRSGEHNGPYPDEVAWLRQVRSKASMPVEQVPTHSTTR